MALTKKTAFNPFNKSVYHFPQAHMLNRGGMFSSVYFREWYLWQGILSDSQGDSWGIAISLNQVVEEGTIKFPLSLEMIHLKSGEVFAFGRELSNLNGVQEGEHEDFYFKYGEEKKWEVGYNAYNDTWTLAYVEKSKGFSLMLEVSGTDNYNILDASGVVSMGEPIERNYDPVKLLGLAFAYFSHHMGVKGTMNLNNEEYSLEGNFCFDHQWGNFHHPSFRHSECNTIKVLFNDYRFARMDLWTIKDKKEIRSLWVDEGEVKSYAVNSKIFSLKPTEQVKLGEQEYTAGWEATCQGRKFSIKPYHEKQLVFSIHKSVKSWAGWAEVLDLETNEHVGTAFMELYGK
ncbi:MAG: carotenoid 1,2-hydratase [Cytophagales bacterium]|nr:carotenoid 1,2-hydratase [Cytophagales bacterium]